jgi:hypothetical protein
MLYSIAQMPLRGLGTFSLQCVTTIDISWLDWAYKSSTCDAMYRRQRRHLYYGGQI